MGTPKLLYKVTNFVGTIGCKHGPRRKEKKKRARPLDQSRHAREATAREKRLTVFANVARYLRIAEEKPEKKRLDVRRYDAKHQSEMIGGGKRRMEQEKSRRRLLIIAGESYKGTIAGGTSLWRAIRIAMRKSVARDTLPANGSRESKVIKPQGRVGAGR